MVAKRIITTLMLNDGILFRSKEFSPDYRYTLNFIDMWSVDELVLMDISRNVNFDDDKKKIFFQKIKEISKNAYVPITAGGGIRELKDIEKLLKNGADKVILNTAAIKDTKFIHHAAKEFGSQCIVICVDVKLENNNFYLMQEYGQKKSDHSLIEYLKIIQEENAGEIFLQSINKDGSLLGYDLELLDYIHKHINIPLVISCGAGNWDHVKEVLIKEYVSGASLTNIFHFTEKSIKILKNHIKDTIFIRN
jgi:imidazole glycerol-phosphate synthase subunit HisF